jgi:hypothetical protein
MNEEPTTAVIQRYLDALQGSSRLPRFSATSITCTLRVVSSRLNNTRYLPASRSSLWAIGLPRKVSRMSQRKRNFVLALAPGVVTM